MSSCIACAISIRSNGSRSGPGSAPANWPWTNEIGSGTKPCVSSTAARSAAIAATPGSLPIRNLVAISQADAALVKTALPASAIADCAVDDRAVSPAIHQRKAWVSSRRFRLIAPSRSVRLPAMAQRTRGQSRPCRAMLRTHAWLRIGGTAPAWRPVGVLAPEQFPLRPRRVPGAGTGVSSRRGWLQRSCS